MDTVEKEGSMHTKTQVTITVNGKERVRTRVACEETGKSFTITHDGARCACGQVFNLAGQRITHRGY
jgi:hypothetical protein